MDTETPGNNPFAAYRRIRSIARGLGVSEDDFVAILRTRGSPSSANDVDDVGPLGVVLEVKRYSLLGTLLKKLGKPFALAYLEENGVATALGMPIRSAVRNDQSAIQFLIAKLSAAAANTRRRSSLLSNDSTSSLASSASAVGTESTNSLASIQDALTAARDGRVLDPDLLSAMRDESTAESIQLPPIAASRTASRVAVRAKPGAVVDNAAATSREVRELREQLAAARAESATLRAALDGNASAKRLFLLRAQNAQLQAQVDHQAEVLSRRTALFHEVSESVASLTAATAGKPDLKPVHAGLVAIAHKLREKWLDTPAAEAGAEPPKPFGRNPSSTPDAPAAAAAWWTALADCETQLDALHRVLRGFQAQWAMVSPGLLERRGPGWPRLTRAWDAVDRGVADAVHAVAAVTSTGPPTMGKVDRRRVSGPPPPPPAKVETPESADAWVNTLVAGTSVSPAFRARIESAARAAWAEWTRRLATLATANEVYGAEVQFQRALGERQAVHLASLVSRIDAARHTLAGVVQSEIRGPVSELLARLTELKAAYSNEGALEAVKVAERVLGEMSEALERVVESEATVLFVAEEEEDEDVVELESLSRILSETTVDSR
ncbi:hypothetical protein H9P43_003602 [Blastocladiella emersonii ATCC 22665]|nr:hypothetical protein H9P43_003602 [Blastocladiella emersonii ATCC 22665]